jgi:tetratricopeptide (TPR) repeat protein
MMQRTIRRTLALALFTLALSARLEASWYDDYDAGLIAAKKGSWATVVQKMTAAIKGNPKEGDRVRTYGVITINYHPYYYRGVAYLNTGRYDDAISDLEKTSGPGPENLGSIDTLMERAKKLASAANEPEPEPTRPDPTPVRPTPPVVTPPPPAAAPQLDPALRQRASAALTGAARKLQAAEQRRATSSPQYGQGKSIYNDATTRFGGARTNDDYNAVITMAENAGDVLDLALPPAAPTAIATTPSPLVPKPTAAATQVLDDYSEDVRRALEQYFAGEFEEAARQFTRLSTKMPRNGWIFAFLGASQYSMWAFEADENYRRQAIESFRRAKALRRWNGGLPPKYFSKKIRKAFSEEG